MVVGCSRMLAQWLQSLQEVCKAHGTRLNQEKYEFSTFIQAAYFADGTPVPDAGQANYLGCQRNDKAHPERELRARIASCMVVPRRMDQF
eukprot:11717734-Prorocentrum_lima.AAC.1